MSSSPIPTVTLDTTLSELYQLDNDSKSPGGTALVFVVPSALVQMTDSLPIPTTFACQAPRALNLDVDVQARANLCAGPQSFGFMAGNMPLILFDPAVVSNEQDLEVEGLRGHVADAKKVFASLEQTQRPELKFVGKPSEILNVLRAGAQISILQPLDCFAHLPHAVNPETHYQLLSKRGLAVSGLPTPKTDIVDCILQSSQVSDHSRRDIEVARMMRPVMTRTPPFVVKFPQSLASHGVYVIQTPEEQKDVVETITPQVAVMIQQLNSSNEHLHPCALIIQDLCPGTPVALSLFVTPTGRAIFTGCTTQIFDANGIFGGGFMDYRQQDTFRTRYTPLMETLGKFLHLNGYHGPIAVDVMKCPSGTDQIIDLNPRASASYPLGFLKTHFSIQRNLQNAALLYLIALKITRDQFERIFAREYQSGQIVICGWCHGKGGPGGIYTYSMISVALGAETEEDLKLLVERVGKYQVQK